MHHLRTNHRSFVHKQQRPHGLLSGSRTAKPSVPHPQPATELRLVSRADAERMIEDVEFLDQWGRLHENCPWAGAFQSPAFARSWYRCYTPDYAPLLIISRTSAGLDGILPLAISADGSSICHLGDTLSAAGGQAWLCRMEDAMQFPKRAVRLLQQQVRLPLEIHNLPNGLPLDWLHHHDIRRTVSFVRTQRPLLRFCAHTDLEAEVRKLDDVAAALEKTGPLSLVRIEGSTQLRGLISDILLYQNLRQAALHVNPPPFQQARRRALNLLLSDSPGLMYATVLKAGDRVVSAQIALIQKRRIHLTALVANPNLIPLHPERLHLRMLARQLYADNFCQLDFPADGDPQWSEMANAHEASRHVTIHPTRRHKVARQVREQSARAARVIFTGLRLPPGKFENLADRLRRVTPMELIRGRANNLRRFIRDRLELRVYRARLEDLPPSRRHADIACNQFDHLLLYEPRKAWQSRRTFIRSALDRINQDTKLFTSAEDHRLLHHIWLKWNPGTMLIPDVQMEYDFPPNSVYLFDAYTDFDSRDKGICSRAVQTMIQDIRETGSCRYIYICVAANNYASRHIFEKMGFQYQTSLMRTVTFGHVRRWGQTMS